MWKFRTAFLFVSASLLIYFGFKYLLWLEWTRMDYVAAVLLAGINLAQWIPFRKGENFWTQGQYALYLSRSFIKNIIREL